MQTKQVVVITGASRGIGRNAAKYFAEKGDIVIATGRNSQKLNEVESLIQELSPKSKTMIMDVTKPVQINEVVNLLIQEYGKIDAWINNAGAFMAIGPTWEVQSEDWLNDVQTNLFGVFFTTQVIVPVMLKQNFGRIINFVGGGTFESFKFGNGYGTSKTAIARFTENLAAELEETPIKVFALDPGLNDTDMTRYQREEEVGKQYLTDIESLFEQNIDVPPHQAPEYAYRLLSGRYDEYAGRIISVYDDLDEYKQKIRENSLDYLKLRWNK